MGNRKQPFGYKMEFGDIVPHPQEADTVRQIYLRYLSGASFKTLTEELREQSIPYDGDKPWNKNMIARILEDDRYIGTKNFPPLLTEEQFIAVQERRSQMQPEKKQTESQKELRKLCGEVPPENVQRKVFQMLNLLIQDPQLIQHREGSKLVMQALKQQRKELDEFLNAPPVDEEQARKMVLAYADAMIDNIGPEEFETERLRGLFGNAQPMPELNAELIRQSVRQITYNRKKVDLLLKNNQWIEGELT